MPRDALAQEQRVRVFISHSTRERDWAQRLAGTLPDATYQIFVASAEPSDSADGLLPGDSWGERLNHEIRLCDLFIVLVSSSSLGSDAVYHEVGTARQTFQTTERRGPTALYCPNPEVLFQDPPRFFIGTRHVHYADRATG